MKRTGLAFLALIFLWFGFSFKAVLLSDINQVPKGFPKIVYPEGNELTVSRWKLGKRLFYDPILSKDSTVSCASCHSYSNAFSDTLTFSIGVEEKRGTRNAPTLANVAYHPYLTRDGNVPSLEMQVLVPIQDHLEFDFNIIKISDRLLKDDSYFKMSLDAYGRYPDSYVITSALACFERTLLSGNSKYDEFSRGDSSVYSKSELNGKQLFFSKRANCTHCHSGFNFTNYALENNGLSLHYEDSGRMRITHNEEDRDRFKVPTLRNIALTAPYMHNGSMETLEMVIEHYSEGIQKHKNLNKALTPIHFSTKEKQDLVAFLMTLSDEEFCTNKLFYN